MGHLIRVVEYEVFHTFEYLTQVIIHIARVFCVRQDLQEFVIGQELESGEVSFLHCQLFVQILLNHVQFFYIFSDLIP
jgi:hypothetical protein